MNDPWRPAMNPDLGREGSPSSVHGPSGALPYGIRSGDNSPANVIAFDKIIRRAYAAPPTQGVQLALFTLGQDQVAGMITFWGVGCPQFDWYGTNEYFLAINGGPPMDQQLEIAGGPGPDGSFFGAIPVGTLQVPKVVHIPVRASDRVSLVIAPQTTPAAGTVVYNIWTRVGGYIWR